MVMIMGLLYIVNQIFQGCGFAPCNHLMVSWVPPKELATKMSLWNTSHSVGAFLVAVICGDNPQVEDTTEPREDSDAL